MKKRSLFLIFALFIQACGSTVTPEPTAIPTPVGYGVEFPFNLDPIKEWGENARVTCEQNHEADMLDPERVRKLVAAGGKLDESMGGDANLTYLWTGNVPLELFVEPEEDGTGFGIYYDVWSTSYCVSGLDERGWSSYIVVITKIVPQQ
jgi:hypothetical protein